MFTHGQRITYTPRTAQRDRCEAIYIAPDVIGSGGSHIIRIKQTRRISGATHWTLSCVPSCCISDA